MGNTINNVKRLECSGCSACANLCPVDAIQMVEQLDGFLYPAIDEQKCIECGLCFDRCPAVNRGKNNNDDEPECYALWAEEEVRMKSSSGGAFTIFAEYVLEQGGYVCGASWNSEWKVEHIIINKKEDLYKLRGSKYIQSSIDRSIYKEIKKLLVEGNKVLFTGCPCQVAGLKAYLGKNYEQLIMVDIVCHGVPSPKAFNKFLKTVSKSTNPEYDEEHFLEQIGCIDFRNKHTYGWNHSLEIKFSNGVEYSKRKAETAWYASFSNTINCRESCGHCNYATLPREGDITMGDFWGVEDFKEDWDDRKGTSIVLANNDRGKEVINIVKERIVRLEKADLSVAKKKNWNLVGSPKTHQHRKRFFELLDMYDDYEKITEYALKRKFDIGYVGWWYGKNYGSALTNFALHQYLKSKGLSVLMLEWPLKSAKDKGNIENSMSRRLGEKYYDISIQRTYEELHDLNWFCDSFIVGSDQLWNYWSTKESGHFYFLDFVEDSKKKIAYSTSFGHPVYGAPNYILKETAFHLGRFDYISVREKDGIDICRDKLGVDAVQTIDPVFICEKKEYLNLIEESRLDIEEPYIFAYILSPSREKREALLAAKKKYGLNLILVLDAQEKHEENRRIMDMDEYIYDDLEIADWLKLIKNCQYIITDSYHGICFSIIFEKQFACIGNIKRGISRFNTLFDLLNLHHRMVFEPYQVLEVLQKSRIEYDEIRNILNDQIVKSKKWLDTALESPKVAKASVYDLLLDKIRKMENEIRELRKKN